MFAKCVLMNFIPFAPWCTTLASSLLLTVTLKIAEKNKINLVYHHSVLPRGSVSHRPDIDIFRILEISKMILFFKNCVCLKKAAGSLSERLQV